MQWQTRGRWPKQPPSLTSKERQVADDWMKYWHEQSPTTLGFVERFNHSYPARRTPTAFVRTLEIGAGLGEQFVHETLSGEQRSQYYAVELRENMVEALRKLHPEIIATVGDCQEKLPFDDGFFDRVIAIHVLEHLCDLPAALKEVRRVLNPQRGVFSVVIPCEGGLLYGMGRRLTSQRMYERRYGMPYRTMIEREHVNIPPEIIAELKKYFRIAHREYFPLAIPSVQLNLCIGLTCQVESL